MGTRDPSTGRFITTLMNDRFCLNCRSNETYLEEGKFPVWFKHKGGYLCKKCYAKLIDNPKRQPINSPRRICYKNESVFLRQNPRDGKCDWCQKKIGDKYVNCFGQTAIIKRTHIHHLLYDDNNALAYTIELCVSCHVKETWRLRKLGL